MREDHKPICVLFVCTANLCRSPTAQGVFLDFVSRIDSTENFVVDSAGTDTRDNGHPPEERAMKVAAKAGYDISGLRARPLVEEDFQTFDYIMAMDSSHIKKINTMQPPDYDGKVALLLEHARNVEPLEVPDPFFGSRSDFQNALLLIEKGCIGLLETLVHKHLLKCSEVDPINWTG